VFSRVVWCCSVRLGKRFALKLVRPVGFCVVLSGGVRLQKCLQGRLDATAGGARLCRCAEADGLGVGAGRAAQRCLGQLGGAVIRVDGTAEACGGNG
jgi:hypothetical protein